MGFASTPDLVSWPTDVVDAILGTTLLIGDTAMSVWKQASTHAVDAVLGTTVLRKNYRAGLKRAKLRPI